MQNKDYAVHIRTRTYRVNTYTNPITGFRQWRAYNANGLIIHIDRMPARLAKEAFKLLVKEKHI